MLNQACTPWQIMGLPSYCQRVIVDGDMLMWHMAGVVLKDGKELHADLVVDCSGRNSSMPQWLEAAGYTAPPRTTVNSGLGKPIRLQQC